MGTELLHANRFYRALSQPTQAAFPSHVIVDLVQGTTLFRRDERPQYAHFLISGLASVVTPIKDGSNLEVGIVGLFGFPESVHLLGDAPCPADCFIQIQARAARVPYRRMERFFAENGDFRKHVLRLVQKSCFDAEQLLACNRFHNVEQRLARWLLMVSDHTDCLSFDLTQEFLSEMLGVTRPMVSLAFRAFKQRGSVSLVRGRIVILDRTSVLQSACECYERVSRLS